ARAVGLRSWSDITRSVRLCPWVPPSDDAPLNLVQRQELSLSFPAPFELQFALLKCALAYGHPRRDAKQVRIAEFLPGAGGPIVLQHLDANRPELVIDPFC